jgi:L-threonylcarbamoyladenylate synthase
MVRIFQSLDDAELITMLKNGAVGVIPTDTVYGLVASAFQQEAVERMYALKARERKPGTSIAASAEQLARLGIDPVILKKAVTLWPNPISIVMTPDAQFGYITQGIGDSPFRVVGNPELLALLEQTGPLATSSANHPGSPPATNFQEAKRYFGDQVDFYVDGIELVNRPASTIVRFTKNGSLEVIREGAIHVTEDGRIG